MDTPVLVALIGAAGVVLAAVIPILLQRGRAASDHTRASGQQPPPANSLALKPLSQASIKTIQLNGRSTDWDGGQWEFTATLKVQQGTVTGGIYMTLLSGPSTGRWYKQRIGESGTEFVTGELEDDVLTVRGHKTDNPHLITKYLNWRIVFSPGWERFSGTASCEDGSSRLEGSSEMTP